MMTESPPREPDQKLPPYGRSTLVITNLIKIGGLIFGARELLTDQDPYVIAACVVMMSGVQGLEQAIILFIDRLFGGSDVSH